MSKLRRRNFLAALLIDVALFAYAARRRGATATARCLCDARLKDVRRWHSLVLSVTIGAYDAYANGMLVFRLQSALGAVVLGTLDSSCPLRDFVAICFALLQNCCVAFLRQPWWLPRARAPHPKVCVCVSLGRGPSFQRPGWTLKVGYARSAFEKLQNLSKMQQHANVHVQDGTICAENSHAVFLAFSGKTPA